MCLISPPRNKKIKSSTIACIIPATGVRPPLFILVIVRATAPVAGNPPKNGATKLAIPNATSSMFELCFLPIIPSATTAESSVSIEPKIASVNAEGNSKPTDSKLKPIF